MPLTPTHTKNAPTTTTWESKPGALYTLVTLDPDAPSRLRPRLRCIVHYLVVNITGSDVSTGHTACKYRGPGPPRGSGKHRYMLLVLQQAANIDAAKVPKFSLTTAGKYSGPRLETTLKNAGSGCVRIVACNWFETEWDPSVQQKQNEQFGWMAGPLRLLLWLLM